MRKIFGLLSVVAVIMTVALIGPSARAGEIGPTILNDNFEGFFTWSAGDSNANGTPAYWGVVASGFGDESAHSGSHMVYCAATGHSGSISTPSYQNTMNAYLSQSFDLTAYSSANLSFWYKIPSIAATDLLSVYVGGQLLWSASNNVPLWTHVSIPLNGQIGTVNTFQFIFYSDAANVAEGAYLDDILITGTPAKATIADAWWTFPLDTDGDGYWSYGTLWWNPNVAGGVGTLNVYEKLYYKLADHTAWILLDTTTPHNIIGSNLADIQNYNVKESTVPSLNHNKYDFRIDIYRNGVHPADYVRSASNDTSLNDRKFERVAEEATYLPSGVICDYAACPSVFGFDVLSNHWAAVGVNPFPSDKDIAASPYCTLGSPCRVSNAGGSVIDFVTVNGTTVGARPYYARVQDGAPSAYHIEAENASPNLTVGATLSGRSFSSSEVLDLYQANLSSGHKYRVRIAQTAGSTSNIALFVFSPARTTGSRGSREAYRNAGGAGAGELLTFTATRSGRWGILVTNENGGAGHYSIKVERLS